MLIPDRNLEKNINILKLIILILLQVAKKQQYLILEQILNLIPKTLTNI